MVCQEHAGTLGIMVPTHDCPCVLVHQLHSVRARSSEQGVAGPWGCRCARCGCTPGPGEQWVWGQLPGWWGAGRMGLGDRYQLPAGCSCGFLPLPGGGCWGADRAARGLLGPTWSRDSGSSLPLSQGLC